MPIIRLNAKGETCELHDSAQPPASVLSRMAKGAGPVIVMIHGFSYEPGGPRHCPHQKILSLDPPPHPRAAPSWPRGLGLGAGNPDEGLGLAFGWFARGSIWGARRRAAAAGRALAKSLRIIRQRAPRRRIHIVAHSMGIEVAAEALHHLPGGAVDRIISMTGACYQSRMLDALQTEAGRSTHFINVTSRENDFYDCIYERLIAPPKRADRTLGQGLDVSNAVTLQLDCPATLEHLSRLGAEIAPPERRICHWSSYLRPGVLRFYSDLLRRPDIMTLGRLRVGLPAQPARRWSRICPRPGLPQPIVLTQKPT
ncbi:alpha/beta hydrolase [Sedimentitalea todarodis]|uniref:Alpha/beta hydrolase n=1 Tax=Sedimentitalea todarodis TaxID=1631240 RepID=A0ABU3VFC2_9RHOB|nr:alpha/beta hydrolase [Sedimentitalea todarodis]MDU9004865.1 alpha/beta hydrolase [Sedimentitalea todarodis]